MLGNVFILGDSYSTFEGFLPEGYAAYYKKAGRPETDVDKVNQTWWHGLLSQTGSVLIRNCSWSGTTICNTGYNGRDCTDNSFVARFDKLAGEGFFTENKIDTFFLFGGTNDSWADSPVGQTMYTGFEKEDLFSVLPAFCYLVDKISRTLPDAKVFCILNTELKQEIEEGICEVCEKYNIDVIKLCEIDKNSGHPTISGMKQIKQQVLQYIKSKMN
ncbi:MAG: hypothetical protein IKT39_02330 [Clostridia bacterium]|nr:hypothetical protein [Clostridia bacterium]